MRTSELTGAALDWAVAKCEGGENTVDTWWIHIYGKDWTLRKKCQRSWSPSTDWAQGGPIIERERIDLNWDVTISRPVEGLWFACVDDGDDVTGPTPLVAAMRCYVASQLGDEIDVPKELTNENQ